MATIPAPVSGIIMGTRKGLTRAGPRSEYTCICSNRVPADAGANHYASAVAVAVIDGQPRVFDSLHRSCNRKLREAVHSPGLPAPEQVGTIEILDLCSELGSEF
jgi:hypothetical protein